MKFLKVLGIVLIAALALFIVIGIFLPKTAHLEKEISIQAPSQAVKDKIVELYEDRFWPIWGKDDTTMVFTPLKNANGYRWEGEKVSRGQCEYTLGQGNTVRDKIRFQGKDIAETTWRLDGSSPTELHLRFTVNAGGNLGARWTNLFIETLSGPQIDAILKDMKADLESDDKKQGTL
ncbi:MAG: hypothetical protein U5N56_03480 [Candidatus Marinimicrobia bacterium]|nr:hypothetical protein [Candidatus Neomarinimicrobiota bacterium]